MQSVLEMEAVWDCPGIQHITEVCHLVGLYVTHQHKH